MLFTTFRPSFITFGRTEKSDVVRTICETFLVAGLPPSRAIPQFDSFRANMSFTPSPI